MKTKRAKLGSVPFLRLRGEPISSTCCRACHLITCYTFVSILRMVEPVYAVSYAEITRNFPISNAYSYMYRSSANSSVTAPIRWPRPPPLLPPRAVKHRLAQLHVDVVVRAAQPLPKVVAAGHARGVPGNVGLEVVGAHPARVQPREEADEAREVRLLRARRRLRVLRRDAVEERP